MKTCSTPKYHFRGFRKVVFLTAMLSACTSTSEIIESGPAEQKAIVYFDRTWIEQNVIGNTVVGKAQFPKTGIVHFEMYFEPGTSVYRDRLKIQNKIWTGFGSYRVLDEGVLCRTSRNRNKGKETCWKFWQNDSAYQIKDLETGRGTAVTLVPGSTL